MEFELDSDRLDVIAPFAIVCSGDLVIERIGPSLRKALGRDLAGLRLLDAFVVERPQGVTTAAEIRERTGSAFLLRARGHDVMLRSQPICPPNDDRIVLFGSVVLTDEADMSQLGLGVTDFAASDPTADLLILKRTQERSLRDLATLNAELEQSASQLRAANTALTEAELRYRTLVEQHPLVTYVDAIDDRSSNIYTSPQIEPLLGYTVDEWQNDPDLFVRILHPEDRERVLAEIERTNSTQEPFVTEYRLVARDGSVVWFRDESVLVRDEDGRPLHRQGYLLDVTVRRTAEQELHETSTRLATLIGSLQAGILLEDEDRKLALTNDAFCAIFGIPAAPADLVGADCRDSAEQSKHLTADPGRFVARIDEILERREAVLAEDVEFADGRIFERDYVPILVGGDDRGHLWGYRDVTPRIEAQREIEKAHDEAVAASRAKTEFLATVSHEIRTPMHGVLGTADLLQQTHLDVEQAELVEILKSSATALLTVINDMLDLQKAEAGHMALASVQIDAAALFAGAVDMLRGHAEAKGLELTATFDETIPRDLLGDPGRLRQILLNLVANAVKFTDAGSVSVRVRLDGIDGIDDGSALLALVVTDTGVGIPPEAQELVFEPFAQADTSSTRQHEGTGLGLSITKQLVELMDGAISLESEPGRGTTVTAVVRLQRGPGTALPESRPTLLSRPLAGTVLVAEDSPVNRELALRQLTRLGVTARAVDSGAAAADALEREHFDLVLMDMRMPGMNGAEATGAIRARERETGRPRTAIVAMTANAMLENRAACLAAGMDDFATKPLVLDELARVLERWLPGAAPASTGGTGAAESTRADETRQIARTLDVLSDELGSTASARRIAELWLSELPGRLDELREAAAIGDTERISSCAHTLKSTSALVGAARASELAAGVERAADDGGGQLGQTAIEDVVTAFEDAAVLVRAWLDDASSSATT